MTTADAKQRFSDRVADYIRYRPGYPSAVRDLVRSECGLRPGHIVADIGSGTGFLSEVFLKNGNRVFGVEPNEAMRRAGEEYLASYDGFISSEGSAEATTLADSSVDFVTAGQAFHWFDADAARKEFIRILRPSGWFVVIWNERLSDVSDCMRDYELLLQKYGRDYAQVTESYPTPEHMRSFFAENPYQERDLPNVQEFDLEGFAGRLRSSSYIPTPDDPKFSQMMAELKDIFLRRQQDGLVRMDYRTRIYFGRLRPALVSPEGSRP